MFLFKLMSVRLTSNELVLSAEKGHAWAPYSNIFFSETAKPIKAKLHVEHPWEGGMKVYINGQGHMTKMAAMAINSKNV